MEKPSMDIEGNQDVSRAALKVALGGGFSLLAGLACQILTAYLFGASSEMDAFFTALTIPLYMQIVLLGGLPFVVIPAFIQEENNGRKDDAWSLTGTMLWITSIALFIIAVLGSIFSTKLIMLSAPGFGAEKTLVSSQMLSIMMFTVPLLGIGSFTSGVENARGSFFIPAIATAIGSAGNFLAIYLLHPILGAEALAWGNLISALLYAGMTTIPVIRHGWKQVFSLSDPRVRELLRLLLPFIIFGMIIHSRLILERFFASGLPDGQIAYLGYANKIANIFITLLASSIASAYFPTMARSFSQSGMPGLIRQSEYGLRVTIAVALPVVILTSVLSLPIVKVFFERGAFLPETTRYISVLIPIVMVNEVLFRMISNMIIRTFFILKDTLTTNLISSLTIILYIVFAAILTQKWQYWGLALAQPLQTLITIILLALLMLRKVGNFPLVSFAKSAGKYLLISGVSGIIGWAIYRSLSTVHALGQISVTFAVSSCIYLAFLFPFDLPVATSILQMTGINRIVGWLKIQILRKKEVHL